MRILSGGKRMRSFIVGVTTGVFLVSSFFPVSAGLKDKVVITLEGDAALCYNWLRNEGPQRIPKTGALNITYKPDGEQCRAEIRVVDPRFETDIPRGPDIPSPPATPLPSPPPPPPNFPAPPPMPGILR